MTGSGGIPEGDQSTALVSNADLKDLGSNGNHGPITGIDLICNERPLRAK